MILVCKYKLFSLCFQGWVIAHFRHVALRKKYEDYKRANPYVGRLKPKRGFIDAGHFRDWMDSMENCRVIWRSYERWRDVTPFQDVCWYAEWIIASKQKMVRHLPERVLRQYGYVQTIPRPPTTIMPLAPTYVAVSFFEFALHVVSQQQRGEPVLDDEPWKHLDGYIKWFYRVSHPLIVAPALVPGYVVPRHVYQEILVEQEGPDILPIHCMSSAAWETEWNMRWRFQRRFQIHSFSAFSSASGPSIACLTVSQFHGGGVGIIVHRSSSSVLF